MRLTLTPKGTACFNPTGKTMKTQIQRYGMVAILMGSVLLAGCGQSEEQKIVATINTKMDGGPECVELPVQVPSDVSKAGGDGALGLLKHAGMIEEGQIVIDERSGKRLPGFTLTEKGKHLVVREASGNYSNFFGRFMGRYPCIRTGKFAVQQILAVDFGQDMNGRQIATVRGTVQFHPEQWIANTSTQPGWEKFWDGIKKKEEREVLFGLLKSGENFYYVSAERVK